MTMEALELEITELTPAEAARIWKRQTKRAPNYDSYRMYINTHDVGHSWNTAVPLDTVDVPTAPADSKEGATFRLPDGRTATLRKNRAGALAWQVVSLKMDDYVKTIKHNFNEAAKERVVFADVTDEIPEVERGAAKSGDSFKLSDGRTAYFSTNGKWTAETAAPVIIRWKSNQHKEKRIVAEGGKKKEIEVSVIDSLEALIVASEAVQTRGPRAVTEEVTVANPPANAKKGAKVTLPDGRKAMLTAAGKWRAPKLETPAIPPANGTENGTAGTDGPTVETSQVVTA